MKNLLMICNGSGKRKNIGDHIQSLAASLFTNPVSEFVERENLDKYVSKDIGRMIMNGWFMHNPDNWPPSNDIKPLITSFHIVPSCAKKMLNKEGVEYLKKHAPIGCRDTGTMQMLQEKDVPCYFSGCLTLALGLKYKNKHDIKKAIFVDPYYEFMRDKKGNISISILLKTLFYGVVNLQKIKKLWNTFQYSGYYSDNCCFKQNILKFLNISAFYKAYSTKFDDSLIFTAEYYTHNITNNIRDEKAIAVAEDFVMKYSKASLVVTSRIHCALPCLGIETPVIFVTSENLESKKKPIRSPGRFGGVINLFRVMNYDNNKLNTRDNELSKFVDKIDLNDEFSNKLDYLPIRDDLIKQCNNFMKEKKC